MEAYLGLGYEHVILSTRLTAPTKIQYSKLQNAECKLVHIYNLE